MPTVMQGRASSRRTMPVAVAAVLDVVAVVAFAAIGRASHAEASSLLGLLGTAWPFVAGLAVGWAVARVWRSPAGWRQGVVVWACAWAVGMALRYTTGQGAATAFLIVAAISLAVVLLGWRLIYWLVAGRRGHGSSASGRAGR